MRRCSILFYLPSAYVDIFLFYHYHSPPSLPHSRCKTINILFNICSINLHSYNWPFTEFQIFIHEFTTQWFFFEPIKHLIKSDGYKKHHPGSKWNICNKVRSKKPQLHGRHASLYPISSRSKNINDKMNFHLKIFGLHFGFKWKSQKQPQYLFVRETLGFVVLKFRQYQFYYQIYSFILVTLKLQ